jgi:hypothetical protein
MALDLGGWMVGSFRHCRHCQRSGGRRLWPALAAAVTASSREHSTLLASQPSAVKNVNPGQSKEEEAKEKNFRPAAESPGRAKKTRLISILSVVRFPLSPFAFSLSHSFHVFSRSSSIPSSLIKRCSAKRRLSTIEDEL